MPNYIPIYENDIIKSCQYHCEIGTDEKCSSCASDNITCIGCNLGYTLENGKCILYYSFKAVYQTISENEQIQLINIDYVDYIITMIVDNIYVAPNYVYTFENEGNHSVYF